MKERVDDFFRLFCNLKRRLAPYRLKTDFETKKTVGVIDELLNRAETLHAGAWPGGRYGVMTGHNVQNLIGRATKYLDALDAGELPLAGLFTEPGRCLVDHSFIEKDGVMHLFYNVGYIGYEWDSRFVDTFGHATSTDMIHWKVQPPVLNVSGAPYENHQIWAPGITEKDGTYYLYYAGVNEQVCQSICVATSKDLFKFEKYAGNPVVTPGTWGLYDLNAWSDCRDPMPFWDDDGTLYLYYCTSIHHADGRTEPALGIASSTDMLHFTDRGAYTFDICDFCLESPFVLKREDKYYLFYTNCGHGTAYAVSDNPIDGWKSLGMLIEREKNPVCAANVPSCAEVICFKNEWYISCAERQPGCEQYLELFHCAWQDDGTLKIGERVMLEGE